jgi:hypothetical protein
VRLALLSEKAAAAISDFSGFTSKIGDAMMPINGKEGTIDRL